MQNHGTKMFKIHIIYCALLFSVVKGAELEDPCVIAFLKQRNLLNVTNFPDYYFRVRTKNCDQIVKKIVKTIYEENYDFLGTEESAGVDNETYRSCLKREFDRHKMDEKFLKAKVFEDEDPDKAKLDKMKDNLMSHIKAQCSKSVAEEAVQRFKQFVSDKGGLSPKMRRHPAILKIKQNIVCMNIYALEKKLLDPVAYNFRLKLINQTKDACELVVNEVMWLIIDEWHIKRKYPEDDEIQRCFIDVLFQTQAIDVFIKNSLLSQLHLTQEQKDFEQKNFVESSNIVHEMSYKCMSIGFEEI